MDFLIVVSTQLLFLLGGPASQWLLHVSGAILTADHEADLSRRIGRDGRVGVFNDGEDVAAGFLELGNEVQVQPLVLRYLRSWSVDVSYVWMEGTSRGRRFWRGGGGGTLCSNDAALLQRAVEKFEVGFFEERLCGAFWIGAVGDDDVELILFVCKECKAVTDVGADIWVLEPNGEAGGVFFGKSDHSFVDVAKDGAFHGRVLDHLTEDATVATADDEDVLRVGVRVHGQVGDHFLVAAIAFSLEDRCRGCGASGRTRIHPPRWSG